MLSHRLPLGQLRCKFRSIMAIIFLKPECNCLSVMEGLYGPNILRVQEVFFPEILPSAAKKEVVWWSGEVFIRRTTEADEGKKRSSKLTTSCPFEKCPVGSIVPLIIEFFSRRLARRSRIRRELILSGAPGVNIQHLNTWGRWSVQGGRINSQRSAASSRLMRHRGRPGAALCSKTGQLF